MHDAICGKICLLCFSLWISGFCNELGDQLYQIQACLPNSRFIRLFKHVFIKCIESHLCLRHSAQYQINETRLCPYNIHRLLLLGTHVAGARKGFPGQKLELGIEGSVPVGQTDGGKGRDCRLADTKAHTPSCRLYGLQRPVLTGNISRGDSPREALFPEPPSP